MSEMSGSGPDVAALVAAALANQANSFVGGGAGMTIADLMTNFPAGAGYKNRYALVTNLFNGTSMSAAGGVEEVLRCRYDVANNQYRWLPQRTDASVSMAATGVLGQTVTINLIPLVTAPTIRFSGTLLGALNIFPDPTNAWSGLRWRTIQNSTLGVFVTTITGLIGSNLTLLGNTTRDIDYSGAAYYST